MNNKKKGPLIILTAFFLIICLSWLIWFFLEKHIDSTSYENRALNSKPILTVDNFYSYPAEYEEYYNDNSPFRNGLITLNNAIDYFVFNKSASDKVVVGKEDWLFYSRKSDGDPIGCYQGKVVFSDEELISIAKNCIKQRDILAEQGKEFVIFIAPNKERIYHEYMPEKYGQPAKEYGALQVVNYLKANTDLRVVYPYDELMRAKKELRENIWYKTDTHWNWVGGYIGACALMSELGIDMPEISSEDIQIIEGENIAGDLAGMLNLTKQLKFADIEYEVTGYDTNNVECLEEEFVTVFRYCSVGADNRKIYVLRDSFSTHMAPYIGSQFAESYLRHDQSYSYEDFLEQDPDIFVYQTVERFVPSMSTFSVRPSDENNL